jgi:hypothetical protein
MTSMNILDDSQVTLEQAQQYSWDGASVPLNS